MCVMACQQIGLRLQAMTGREIPAIRVDPRWYSDTPLEWDQDLLSLANLWFPQRLFERLPYPPEPRPLSRRQRERFFRPRTLVIGTSFSTQITRALIKYGVCDEVDLFYYFKTHQVFPSGTEKPIDPKTLDWEKDVFSHDVIILEENQFILERAGFGFVEAALEHLPRTQP